MKIQIKALPSGGICLQPAGFATLKDRVFLVENFDGKCIARNLEGVTREIESEITRPAIKIASFDTECGGKWTCPHPAFRLHPISAR